MQNLHMAVKVQIENFQHQIAASLQSVEGRRWNDRTYLFRRSFFSIFLCVDSVFFFIFSCTLQSVMSVFVRHMALGASTLRILNSLLTLAAWLTFSDILAKFGPFVCCRPRLHFPGPQKQKDHRKWSDTLIFNFKSVLVIWKFWLKNFMWIDFFLNNVCGSFAKDDVK